MDRDACELLAHDLALACVQPGAHLNAEHMYTIGDGAGAADGAGRSIEGG
jgi:hypothetical protein